MLLVLVFVAGYLFIALEAITKINKAGIALLMAAIMWSLAMQSDPSTAKNALSESLSSASEILFFLLGAMTIVELIDAHNGFDVVTRFMKYNQKKTLAWLVALLAFFLSSILDNLTTTIVMVTIIRKIIPDKNDRQLLAGLTVIASNAGGAWSPIGDVTTTMLWIGGQITPLGVILHVIIPSLICLLIPTFFIARSMKGTIRSFEPIKLAPENITRQKTVLISGILVLFLVPMIKQVASLPPYMGMLSGLGFMWVLLEWLDRKKESEEKSRFTVERALQRIDTPSILFFLGILLSIGALELHGTLHLIANKLNTLLPNDEALVMSLGFLSAILDNVPLVAAVQAMFTIEQWPADAYQWHLLAYASGTGGSILVIGSAAGVAAMGLEDLNFGWYLKKISLPAILGFLAGFIYFQLF